MTNLMIAGIFGIMIIAVSVSMSVLPCEFVWIGDALTKCLNFN